MLKLWHQITFVLQKAFKKERVAKFAKAAKVAIAKGEEGLDEHFIHGPEADAALKLADATQKLVNCLAGHDQAVIRAGPLLVVKITSQGKSKLAVETVSARVRRILDENPRLPVRKSAVLV